MQLPEGLPLQTQLLFLEGASGVQQVLVGLFDDQPTPRLVALKSAVMTGDPPQIDRNMMHEAVQLNDWAHRNPDVILEGRVAY